jgi:hypothetical protein
MFMVFNATFNNIFSHSVGLNVMWLFPNQPIDTRTLYIQLYNLHEKIPIFHFQTNLFFASCEKKSGAGKT